MTDPQQTKRETCRRCRAPLSETQTRYCSKRCSLKAQRSRRQKVTYKRFFLPRVKSVTTVWELMERSGLSEEEIVARVLERVEAGTVLVHPSPKWFISVGIRKEPERPT